MPVVPINYLAVLVSGLVGFGLGWAWFGPLFGTMWMQLMGTDEARMKEMMAQPGAQAKMMRSYAFVFVGALVMAFVLAHAIIYADAYMSWSGATSGVIVGFLNWLGFVVPPSLGMVLWEGKSWKLWSLVNGYWLVSLVVMGVILAVWM